MVYDIQSLQITFILDNSATHDLCPVPAFSASAGMVWPLFYEAESKHVKIRVVDGFVMYMTLMQKSGVHVLLLSCNQ